MGIGAAIGGIVGGISSMKAAKAQQKAGQQSAAMSEEAQRKAEAALGRSEAQYAESVDYAKEFQSMLGDVSAEYGEYASQMMQDWENNFGTIQSNLIDYYENLDPTKFSTQAKAQLGMQIDKGMEQFNEAAAQSGIYTSGMKLQAEKEAQYKKAEGFAQADIAAPEHVMGMKDQFYGKYGEPARQQAQGVAGQAILNQGQMGAMGYNAVNNAQNNLAGMGSQYANLYSGQSSDYAQSAAGYGQAAGTNMGSGFNSALSGVTSLFGGGDSTSLFSDARLKNNITLIGKERGHNIYSWDWTKEAQSFVGNTPTRGVIAQEVLETNPNAVSVAPNGFLVVNYGAL